MGLNVTIKTADPLPWSEMQRIVPLLIQDNKKKMALLIAAGAFLGLRHSDLVRLRFCDLLESDKITLIEIKTKKKKRIREMTINPELKRIAELCKPEPYNREAFCFANRKGNPESISYHNAEFLRFKKHYNIDCTGFSQHSTRKCFALRVYEMMGKNEHALITLQHLLKHSSTQITLCYLGLRRAIEIDVYKNL